MIVKRYTHHWSSYKPSFMDEQSDGGYVLHSDYAALLTRHNALVIEHAALLINNTALVEAVEWEMECEDVAQWRYEVWEMAEVGSGDCEIYTVAQCIHDEARSEVERLIATESAADCKGEG